MDTPIIEQDMPLDPIESKEEFPHVSKFSVGGNISNMKNKKIPFIPILIITIVLVLISVLVLYFVRRSARLRELSVSNGNSFHDNSDKIMNPLSGEYFSVDEASLWINTRPLSVMINNAVPARPQSGLIYADITYEIVAEGGITRFLSFFNSNIPNKIGPVRSTRDYYLRIVKELGDAMVMHEGFSPQAQVAIDNWPVRSLFRGGAGCPWEGENKYCIRDNPRNVAIEHTAYAKGPALIERSKELGWDGTSDMVVWQFKDDTNYYDSYPIAEEISIDFWYKGDYSAVFKYDSEKNVYKRFMGYDENDEPIPHVDQDNNEQIAIRNVIVQFSTERPVEGDDKSRLVYELVGSGTALIFVDGKVVEATWTKSGRDDRTMFYDLNGEEIKFSRGKFWVSIVPDRNTDQVVFN